MARVLNGFSAWPDTAVGLTTIEVIKLYHSGFAGAFQDPEISEQLNGQIIANSGIVSGEDLATSYGFAGDGAGKLVVLFPAVLRYYGSEGLTRPGQQTGDCFQAGTQVLGVTTKSIEDVEIGDKVWTGEGKLTEVISRRELLSHRPMVKITPVGGVPLTCTADHKILVYRMARVAGKRVSAHYAGREKISQAVVDCYESREATWVKAGDLTDTDCLLAPTSLEAVIERPDDRQDFLGDEFGRFMLGYFIGNGHASGSSVEWWTPSESQANEFKNYLEFAGYHVSPLAQKGEAYRVRVSSVELVAWFCEQCYYGKQKNLPGWAIQDDFLIDGLVAADGFDKGSRHYFDSTSPSLTWGVRANMIARGYEPTAQMLSRSAGTYDNAKPLCRLIWQDEKTRHTVWRDDSFVCYPIRKIERIEGPTVVYDIGVKDDHHSFIANGMACSNCVSMGGRDASLYTICLESAAGLPDERTGKIEQPPVVSETARKNGVFCNEGIYLSRGHNGQGMACSQGVKWVTSSGGILVRQKFDKADLESYNVNFETRGSAGAPAWLSELAHVHPIQDVTRPDGHEAARDFIARGKPIWLCSNLGFASTRDANGHAKKSGSWSHSWHVIGYDDRPEIIKEYGVPQALAGHRWGPWNSGPRRILGTDVDIPEGYWWLDAPLLDNCDMYAVSGANGWASTMLPDYLPGFK